MKILRTLFLIPLIVASNLVFADNSARDAERDASVAGLYKAVLQHEGSKFYQFADVTLRTLSTGSGSLKISANVKVYFGDRNSNEFLTYEFDDCPLNLLTRQISIKNDKNNVSFVGFLKTGTLEGDWFSTVVGKVGKFSALKDSEPKPPADGILVKTLTGHYRGALKNTNPESNLPERATMSLVSFQDTSGPEPIIKISGNVRLYLGEFGSLEYVETKLSDVQFNFYNRYLTARTADYGLTFKGTMSHEGVFKGTVFADGLGEVAEADLKTTSSSVVALTGRYLGKFSKENSDSSLPERAALTLVKVDPSAAISGTVRFYVGDFDSLEYMEAPVANVQFEVRSGQLGFRVPEHGLTFKGSINVAGTITGHVYSDSLGAVAKAELNRAP